MCRVRTTPSPATANAAVWLQVADASVASAGTGLPEQRPVFRAYRETVLSKEGMGGPDVDAGLQPRPGRERRGQGLNELEVGHGVDPQPLGEGSDQPMRR